MRTNTLKAEAPKTNEMARALFHRAGTACVAVAVDTRPKAIRNRKVYTRKGRGRGFDF